MRAKITNKYVLVILSSFFIIIVSALLYVIRPPGQPSFDKNPAKRDNAPYFVNEGDLPGVTWVDDIHPIFTRNICVKCHIRGQEAIAEGFEELALGLIDPKDKSNAFYSYHELVYAEGPPQIQKGETLRDGQCCWPRNYPPEQQRRIWAGRAERSAIMRKLDRDYYDWRKLPRFFEEGLELLWGPPMPMYHNEEEHEKHEFKYYEIRPFYERIFLHLSLWLGGGRDELHAWPPRIPARDRALLRYWINHTLQVMEEGTGIEVQVSDSDGSPVEDAIVRLVGNYNSPERREVADQIAIKTDEEGTVLLYFPEYSVISSFWFAAAEKDGARTDFEAVEVSKGKINKIRIMLVVDTT
jgi:hypothetical protein